MKRLLLLVSILLILTVQFSPTSAEAPARSSSTNVSSLSLPSPETTKEIQLTLRSYGYAVAVDGLYGPQTTKAVRHWQRANGLVPDGVAGPQTLKSLGLNGPAQAQTPAQRVDPPQPQTGTPGNCESYRPLVEVNGMPWAFFGPVMYRESHCIPTSYNGRGMDQSYGLFQLNTKGALWGELSRRCGLGYMTTRTTTRPRTRRWPMRARRRRSASGSGSRTG